MIRAWMLRSFEPEAELQADRPAAGTAPRRSRSRAFPVQPGWLVPSMNTGRRDAGKGDERA